MVELLWLMWWHTMVIMVKVNPPLMSQPGHSLPLTSVNLLQKKTKKILAEIVCYTHQPSAVTASVPVWDLERRNVWKENNWDSSETPPLWPGTGTMSTATPHNTTPVIAGRTKTSVLALPANVRSSSRVVKWVMSLQTQLAFYSPTQIPFLVLSAWMGHDLPKNVIPFITSSF